MCELGRKYDNITRTPCKLDIVKVKGWSVPKYLKKKIILGNQDARVTFSQTLMVVGLIGSWFVSKALELYCFHVLFLTLRSKTGILDNL